MAKKRIAYVGISYPVLYDYACDSVVLSKKEKESFIGDSNPIIENPWGIMILYDEIIFACEQICPLNMRCLPYVKFANIILENKDFKQVISFAEKFEGEIQVDRSGYGYREFVNSMNISDWNGLDTHTHMFRIGNAETFARSCERDLLVDIQVWEMLKEFYNRDIELLCNSSFKMNSELLDSDSEIWVKENSQESLVERIMLNGIPNYLTRKGPYDERVEKLRENQYISDFRKWIIENHSHLQRSEIKEVSENTQRVANELAREARQSYFNASRPEKVFCTNVKTAVLTAAGMVNALPSIIDAVVSINSNNKLMKEAKSAAWSEFVNSGIEDINTEN